ncbi:ABC transporter substrate-binding protein [Pseudobutyrivibrio xylanivorans]|uniref:ABC transporter substrate-binding protein n=1 Tax=Pseudobutyrivibrio xylanivorans TaxID=185007 RepID=A0A5P6VU30_PSEXY|nr:ABC transporter substrate-binding protein [Pseudobutyrivibrio xylanivorans]QFJ54734.1 ABC transporter substrate-binding protein [Pseudobutyrivibrio xylanivorans]
MKKLLSVIMASALALSLVACGTDAAAKKEASNDSEPAVEETATTDDSKTYNVGVIQLVQHPALDAATEGFQAALVDKLGSSVNITVENASGDNSTCATIANSFVSDNVDLIMANATPALQASGTATSTIPIVATSITDYATALGISVDDWSGATGVNVTGTSDLAPLDGQAEMLKELFPDAKEVGIIYCSGEDNSKFQAGKIKGYLEDYGYTVSEYTFSDSSDVATVVQSACGSSDVLYVPTDNVAASCAETINNVAVTAKVPIVAGEEGICKGCGIATLSISYYDIGYAAGLMAYEILANGADPATMDIQYAPEFTKEYNPTIAEQLGITLPDDYVAIEME